MENEKDFNNKLFGDSNLNLNKRNSDASSYHTTENQKGDLEDEYFTNLLAHVSEEENFHNDETKEKTKEKNMNNIESEIHPVIDTLILKSATKKHGDQVASIKLDTLYPSDYDLHDNTSMLSNESAVFFDDKIRRIDFILVYQTDSYETLEEHSNARAIFENNLIDEGLELEHVFQEDAGLTFVKVHAPWEVLSRYGEILKFKMPMKEVPDFDFSKYYLRNLFNRMTGLARSVSDLHPEAFGWRNKDCRFSTVYSRDKEYLFDIPRKKEDFFSPAQRSRIVQFILKRKSFTNDPTDVFGFGIKKLLADGIYIAAYPLHEGDLNDKNSNNPRWFLIKNWASYKCLLKTQPLDEIKHYFGVKIGLYFAWLGFYTYMLIPASVVGLLCFIYGCVTMNFNVPSNEICTSTFIMCPKCEKECNYWFLKESCNSSRITYLVDNAATVLFSIFMSLWGAVFLELWKRYSADITHRWDLTGFDTFEEHPRPEYLARLANERKKKLNFITRMYEPYVPFWRKRLPYTLVSASVVVFLVTLALGAVVGVILYRISVNAALLLSQDRTISTFASIITSTTAAILNLVCIMIFNQFYTYIATYLTELELHRTQTEFDDSLTLKMFLLQFVNYYSSIIYIAFFKGKLLGHPGDYKLLFRYRQEECGAGGCLMELAIQLSIIMVGKQALNNLLEITLPWITWFYQWWKLKRCTYKGDTRPCPRWEEDYALAEWGPTHLFFEYLEMILQFGFVTIFVAAFPLAPLFALLNNILEIRLDARKLVCSYRRPVGVRVQNIGIWFRILDSIGKLAVFTNAIIIAFTSDMIPRLMYRISHSPDMTLNGYMNYSLSLFNTSEFSYPVKPFILPGSDKPIDVPICRYRDFREPPSSPEKYEFTEEYWNLLALRFAFVLVFENVILMLTTLTRWLIPDVPKKLRERIRHENFITNEILITQELQRAKGQTIIYENSSLSPNMKSDLDQESTKSHPHSLYDMPIVKETLI